MNLLDMEKSNLNKLKIEYNKALKRYINMIENVSEEEQLKNYEYVVEIINNCNNLLNKIKQYDLVAPGEVIGGFKI